MEQNEKEQVECGTLYHSDQGTVYLSPTFQEEVAELGFTQSVLKRGNCQDNAPMESFFGDSKDECPYLDCETLDELQELVKITQTL